MLKTSRGPIEMEPFDLDTGWTELPGFPEGLLVKFLADDLDEDAKSGARTRLVKFTPGAFTTHPLVHDYWEEVVLLRGTLRLSTGAPQGADTALTYSCRPPGTSHGPFHSDEGCILLEFQYYLR
ncbi:cupin domain-containing protein [Xanthobacter flavus]|uniref:cupin domain-containing protein n=1 Tax=Xanthobacter flavus TaxID=281 RepID=UPI00372986F3